MEEQQWDNEEKYFEEGDVDSRAKKLKEKMYEWCQKGDLVHFKKYLNDSMLDINDPDSSGWTLLIWGVVNNNVDIVKTILEKTNKEPTNESINESQLENDKEEEVVEQKSKIQTLIIEEKSIEDAFKKPVNQNNNKYNPLHWAAYKGNILMSSLLLKAQYNPIDIDMYGNTSLHQAAASNNKELFKLFMGLGLDIEMKNARNHIPIELTHNDEIKKLIKKTAEALKCQLCSKLFNFYETKYLCYINEEITCKECSISAYYYDAAKDAKKEILENRCKICFEEIEKEESKLREAISQNNLVTISSAYDQCKLKRINPKLKIQAETSIERLKREKKIHELIGSLEKVDDHKTIEKSVQMLLKEEDDARSHGILIDNDVLEKIEHQKNKKLAEKELRKLINNSMVFDSSPYLKDEIENKLKLAIETKVDDIYLNQATELLNKVILNLECINVFQMLATYPPREYKPVETDKKKKKPEPVKKKKKKEAPFPMPTWAITNQEGKSSEKVKQKLDKYISFIKIGGDIGLKEEFINKSKEILSRFQLEINHLKREEEELRLIEEEKAKKAKKKK